MVVREATGVLLFVSSASRAHPRVGCARVFRACAPSGGVGVVEIGVVLWFTVFWMSFVSFSLVRVCRIGRLVVLPIRVSVLMSLIWRRLLCRFTLAVDGLYAVRWWRVGASPCWGAPFAYPRCHNMDVMPACGARTVMRVAPVG